MNSKMSSKPMKSMAMTFARKRISKERNPIKLNVSSNRIGSVKAGKSMKSGRPRAPHSVISRA
jgi:hypothetical protein